MNRIELINMVDEAVQKLEFERIKKTLHGFCRG